MNDWSNGWRGRLVLAAPAAAFALALFVGEVATRLLLPPLLPLEFLVTDPHQRDHLEEDRDVEIFEADPLLFWRLKANLNKVVWDFTLVSTNGGGLRQPRERPISGARKVVSLGDSVTFGYRVPLVWPDRPTRHQADRPYPLLLEEALTTELGEPADVTPLAVPGYTSHQGRAWLERVIARHKPELVTVCFGWNDVSTRALSDRDAMPTSAARVAARSLVLRSQLLMRISSLARATRRSRPRPYDEWVPRVSLAEYLENHLAIARLAERHGARALVIGPVYRDAEEAPEVAERLGEYRSALASSMADAGVPYLEVESLTESAFPQNRSLFGEAIHPNGRGHRLLAGAIHQKIVQARLLAPRHR